jgi:hypothetical protein
MLGRQESLAGRWVASAVVKDGELRFRSLEHHPEDKEHSDVRHSGIARRSSAGSRSSRSIGMAVKKLIMSPTSLVQTISTLCLNVKSVSGRNCSA